MLSGLGERLRGWGVSHAAPEIRSVRLLKANLSPIQREQYESFGYFDVLGSKTATRYRIHHGSQLNVEQLDAEGRRVRLLCFKPTAKLAIGDVMLAQKLALELFEPDAIRISERFLAAPPCRHYISGTSLQRAYRALSERESQVGLPGSRQSGAAAQYHRRVLGLSATGATPSHAKRNPSSGAEEGATAAEHTGHSAAFSPVAAHSPSRPAHTQATYAIPGSKDAADSKA